MIQLPDRPVFFSHIPRSGGTTLIRWVNGCLGDDARYPGADPARVLAEKMYPAALESLTDERLAAIRFFAPHLPVAARELLAVETSTVVLVRDPVDQIRSALDVDVHGDDGADLLRRFETSPNRWYVTNQLGWYLGATVGDVRAVFDRVVGVSADRLGVALQGALSEVMAGRSLVDAACERLGSVDALGLTEDRGEVESAVARWLGVTPPDPDRRLNEGGGSPLPAQLRERLVALTTADRRIYEHARALILDRRAE